MSRIPISSHIVAVTLDGEPNEAGVQKYQRLLKRKLQEYDEIGIYVDTTMIAGMSSEAIIESTETDSRLLNYFNQISRCAFISDQEWAQVLVCLVRPLVPKLKMKVFPSSQSEAARIWTTQTSKKANIRSGAIRFLPTDQDNILAFEVNDLMSSVEMAIIVERFEHFFATYDKVCLLNRIKHFGDFHPYILIQKSGLLSMKLSTIEKVEHYASVGASDWMNKVINSVKPVLSSIDLQTFGADEEAAALAWLEAEFIIQALEENRS